MSIQQAGTGEPTTPIEDKQTQALEYSRRLFENVLHWYDNADKKAQIVLAFNGAFITFLTSSIFMKQTELEKIAGSLPRTAWLCLALMSVCLIGSILGALACLWSRIWSWRRPKDNKAPDLSLEPQTEVCRPQDMWFFKNVYALESQTFEEQLAKVNVEYEIKVLGYQIHTVAGNVTQKHLYVNLAFVMAGSSFILFLAAGISYLLCL